jgi:YfiR/HmsC-like
MEPVLTRAVAMQLGHAAVAGGLGVPANWRMIRCLSLLAFVSLFPAGAGKRIEAQTDAEEYRVKAAFIFHFAQLVEWPPEKATGTDNSLVLCTLGEDPFQGLLEGTVAGKAIGNRILRVRHLEQPQDMQACQIVFLGRAQSKRIPTLVSTLHQAPVLTVGETAGFLDAGGMIDFLLEGNKVRFEINLDAAESADLKIGSRLLVLAERVVGESHGK